MSRQVWLNWTFEAKFEVRGLNVDTRHVQVVLYHYLVEAGILTW